MAGKEGAPQPKGAVDQGLETWQNFNKLTLTAEAVAIAGGYYFGYPWLMALGTAVAVVDGAQIIAINQVQRHREKRASSPEKKHSMFKRFGDIFVRSKHKGTQREHALAA